MSFTTPIALYTTTINPVTGDEICDGWLPAFSEIHDVEATISEANEHIRIDFTMGGGLAGESMNISPASVARLGDLLSAEDTATADYLKALAEKGAEMFGWGEVEI